MVSVEGRGLEEISYQNVKSAASSMRDEGSAQAYISRRGRDVTVAIY